MTTKTRSQEIAEDVAALVRARNPLIWIVTREEARVEGYIIAAAKAAKYMPRTWDCASGVCEISGAATNIGGQDVDATIDAISKRARAEQNPERGIWIMRDLPFWITGPSAAMTVRRLRNLVRMLPGSPRESAQTLVVLSPSGDVPAELSNHTMLIEWPLPDREEMSQILKSAVEPLRDDVKKKALGEKSEAAVDAAVGLSEEEAKACYAKSLVKTSRIDPAIIAQEKKRVIAREKVLEWMDPIPGGLEAVGGLDYLKKWLRSRAASYSPEARAFGLPMPKGAIFVGVSGCGKTLMAKATAAAWEVPLVRFDFGALKSKFVGDSEARIRAAYRVIEAMGRCVVLIDEIEKGLQGATSGSADGGVSADALGSFLTWMQERQSEAFVVATANGIENMPPELLRKGRFDEIFFVDLPNLNERKEILATALRAHKRELLPPKAMSAVAAACNEFTGAEVASLVPEALFAAFADDQREITRDDLIMAAADVVPLIKTAPEKIKNLREWAAKGSAKYATSQNSEASVKHVRQLDLEEAE